MNKNLFLLLVLLINSGLLFSQSVAASAHLQENISFGQQAEETVNVDLYFFWSISCPHCQEARPFIEFLSENYPWIKVHSNEISRNRDNLSAYQMMATELGQDARSVPAFFICGGMFVGWDKPQSTGQTLLDSARRCRDEGVVQQPDNVNSMVKLPLLGELETSSLSLPVFTLIIAGLDAFNPCAFFILLFLLSLLVHARSRRRMLLVGMTFILVSGLIYFVFMAAWLNLFLIVGSQPYVTMAAGLIAIVFGALNSKDFFNASQGPSLGISASAKPGIFKRMAGLISADHLPTLLLGTFTLAMAVNSYELLCTAGFPMVYTRTLTMHQLSETTYYLYLALYNFIYIIPLMIIVGVFTATLGSRKLSQNEGRLLKLLSGIMMLLLGFILILAPQWLNNLLTGASLLATALVLAGLIWIWQKKKENKFSSDD